MFDSFETERLAAERLSAAHLPDLCRMHRDPRVMATLGGVRADDATRAYLETNLQHWVEHGFGLYVLLDKTDQRFVGRAGLRHVEIGGRPEIELAYALVPGCWGVGLATETGRALLPIGFNALGLRSIVCFAMTINHASQRVMTKLGFSYERDIDHRGHSHVLYRLARSRT